MSEEITSPIEEPTPEEQAELNKQMERILQEVSNKSKEETEQIEVVKTPVAAPAVRVTNPVMSSLEENKDIPEPAPAVEKKPVEPEKKKPVVKLGDNSSLQEVTYLKELPATRELSTTLEFNSLIEAIQKPQKQQPSYEVVALRSGLKFSMGALNFSEIQSLLASNLTRATRQRRLVSIIYSKIISSSVPLSEREFMEKIAADDIDSLIFGIYAITYPGKTTYTTNCIHCDAENKIEVTPENLVYDESGTGIERVREILSRGSAAEQEFLTESPVNQEKYLCLPESGIIFSLSIPSIHRQLDLVDRIMEIVQGNEEVRAQRGAEIPLSELLNFIRWAGIPTPDGQMVRVNDHNRMLTLMTKLSPTDGEYLYRAAGQLQREYVVDYKLPTYRCVSCRKENDGALVNLENLLFFRIRQTIPQT